MEKNTFIKYIGVIMAKSQNPRKKKQELVKQLEETEKLLKQAEEEDAAEIKSLEEMIANTEKDKNVFFGVILNIKDIAVIIESMVISGKDRIEIPTKVYHREV
jgi:hypothetical protein